MVDLTLRTFHGTTCGVVFALRGVKLDLVDRELAFIGGPVLPSQGFRRIVRNLNPTRIGFTELGFTVHVGRVQRFTFRVHFWEVQRFTFRAQEPVHLAPGDFIPPTILPPDKCPPFDTLDDGLDGNTKRIGCSRCRQNLVVSDRFRVHVNLAISDRFRVQVNPVGRRVKVQFTVHCLEYARGCFTVSRCQRGFCQNGRSAITRLSSDDVSLAIGHAT
tara:strand:+ start:1027 stop:1677 length:651 start_codon:yes stop_codon:yes gene_type:complete